MATLVEIVLWVHVLQISTFFAQKHLLADSIHVSQALPARSVKYLECQSECHLFQIPSSALVIVASEHVSN